MNKVDTVRVEVTTGEEGTGSPVRMQFNGHEVELVVESGTTGPGETFVGSFDVRSVAHSVFLLAPENGRWALDKVVARYEGATPETREYGPVVLEPGSDLDIWAGPPPAFEV